MKLECVVCKAVYDEAVNLISHMNIHSKIEIVRDLTYYLVLKEKENEKDN